MYKYKIVISIISLYNKIIIVSREIMNAQALAADSANSAGQSLCCLCLAAVVIFGKKMLI
jgi:hypothetical protein